MTDKFKICIPVILKNEGGFVNDQADPGGATNFGISLRFLKGTGDLKDFDLDHDSDIDLADIKLMNPEVAEKAYFDYFWKPLQIEQLSNPELALQVFDTAVNAGAKTAIKTLQKVVGVKVDGLIGPKTIAAANTFSDNIAEFYREERENFYIRLVVAKPKFKKFRDGWLNRCQNTRLS